MLDRLKGQKKAKLILNSFIERNRIPSSMIFTGMEGVGKRTAALYFAMALNCFVEVGKGCGQCSACRRIEKGAHPDVFIIEGLHGIGIEEIRGIQKKLHFRPVEGMKNVIIIDRADNMTHPACNALLKTLEEPPSHSVIILITSSPHSLPATVVSRCYRVPFEPLGEREIFEILTENYGIDKEKAMVISTICDGSIGRALEREGFLSIDETERILSILISLRKATIEEIGGYARELGKRDDLYLDCFFNLIRNFLLDGLKYKIDSLDNIKYKGLKQGIEEFLNGAPIDDILLLIGKTGRYQRILPLHPNKPLLMELYLHEIRGIFLR